MASGDKAWGLLRPAFTVGKQYGANVRALERKLGSPGVEVNALRGVPVTRVFEVWAELGVHARDPALPLRAAQTLRLEDLEVFGFSVLTAPSGLEAFTRAMRFLPLLESSGRWSADVGDDVQIRWTRAGDRWLGHRLANESGFAQFVVCLRQVYGENFALKSVSFRHPAPTNITAHRAFYGCKVDFGDAVDGFSFSRKMLDRTPPLAHGPLAEYLRTQAEHRLRARERTTSFADGLRALVELELESGTPDLSATRGARALGVSERTLRRQLELEGTSFRSVVSEAQRRATQELLARVDVPITEVAFRVGFADSSTFAHAVRRWFGRSARDVRKQSRG